jgi:hypothetical protein
MKVTLKHAFEDYYNIYCGERMLSGQIVVHRESKEPLLFLNEIDPVEYTAEELIAIVEAMKTMKTGDKHE